MEKKERKKTKAVVKKDIYTLTFHKVSKGTSINDVWFVFDFLIIFFFCQRKSDKEGSRYQTLDIPLFWSQENQIMLSWFFLKKDFQQWINPMWTFFHP